MKRGRASEAGAVHALSTAISTVGLVPPRQYGALCGTSFTSEVIETGDPGRPRFRGSWRVTEEHVTCRRCLDRMERLAEQALQDGAAIALIAAAAARPTPGGSRPRPASAETVRAFRRTWPAMGRAVADLLRHRGVRLGEGWLGPARAVESRD